MRILKLLGCLLLFLAGFGLGGYAFVQTQSRPLPLPGRDCKSALDCATDVDLMGLVVSSGLHVAPGFMPRLIARSEHCVGIVSPRPEAPIDLVFFPLKDIRNLLEVAPGDEAVLMDCFALMRQVARQRGIKEWQVLSNGPGQQTIAYLHFHLFGYGETRAP